MLDSLDYQREGTTPEQVFAMFNNELGVSMWRTPVNASSSPVPDDRDPDAPLWWVSDEEASQAFLAQYAPGLER